MPSKIPQAICLGELLIDFVALENGPLDQVTGFLKKPGGAPANVAIALQRLGLDCGFISQVGQDPFGQYLVKVVSDEGVDTSQIKKTKKARTGLAFVSLKDNGDRDFSFYRDPSADMLLSQRDIKPSYFSNCRYFHFGSISLICEFSRKATYQAIEYAQNNKALISYDPNLRMSLWDSAREAKKRILEGLKWATLVKVSQEELHFLIGNSDPQKGIEFFRKQGKKLILLTYAEKGAWIATTTQQAFMSSFDLAVVDTTGAGDAFIGAVLSQLSRKKIYEHNLESLRAQDLQEILLFAHAAGGLTTTSKGAIPSLPSYKEVKKFLKNKDLSLRQFDFPKD